MFYILNDAVSLRSWWYIPYAFYTKGGSGANGLSEEEFNLLMKCDGHTEIEHSELLDNLIKRGLCKECEYGTELTEWQKYKDHDNRYMPKMNLQITGRCNYNCKHCFNAKDNSPLQSELSLEQLKKLFDECVDCGVRSFTITGGEPMAHPHYKEIIEEIYKRGMTVFDLNTNGFYINQEMLDWMKSINYKPLVKISYDGIGFHNWMRGYDKADERTLEAIKLCVANGFDVKIQMNVNKKNIDSIVPSLIMLDKMGVKETRFIKTTAAPRWLENSNGESMSLEEYYDASIEIVKEYLSSDRKMEITGWLLLHIDPAKKYFNLNPVVCRKGEFRESILICKGARNMIAVGSNGNVFPCMQAQGFFEGHNVYLGNVVKDGLKNVLGETEYMDIVSKTVKDRMESGSKCKDCKYFKACTGGCPCMAILTNNNSYDGYLKEDFSKCIFFKKGYYQKFVDAMPKDFENIKPLDVE